jgi:hypothetical protein
VREARAEPGLRRQDAGANIGAADGPTGAPQERRVIHFDLGGPSQKQSGLQSPSMDFALQAGFQPFKFVPDEFVRLSPE